MPNKVAKYTIGLFGVLVAVVIAWLVAIPHLPPRFAYSRQIGQVERYIVEIENYKRQFGTYPDERTQKIVPRAEHDNPYFYQGGGTVYRVGFRVGFDETYFYESQSRKWSFEE